MNCQVALNRAQCASLTPGLEPTVLRRSMLRDAQTLPRNTGQTARRRPGTHGSRHELSLCPLRPAMQTTPLVITMNLALGLLARAGARSSDWRIANQAARFVRGFVAQGIDSCGRATPCGTASSRIAVIVLLAV